MRRYDKFFRRLLKGSRYVLRMLITDKLKSYQTAKPELNPSVEHSPRLVAENRNENSHQATGLLREGDETF